MRRFVVVLLLVLFVMSPVAAVCEPIQCDWAMETGKVLDWVICAIVVIALGNGEEIPGGYHMYYP